MMTPQEVASHAFPRATLGGYNMSMVDDFLDLLTEDYTALYNDNAILKNKLKVLSDTVEEYRATDDAMRKTLLAAQKMADSLVADAESKKAFLLADAEEAARQRINELQAEIAAEEYRLKVAQESTANYVAELTKLYEAQYEYLSNLSKLAPKVREAEFKLGDTMSDIKEAMSHLNVPEEKADAELDDEPTTVIPFAPTAEEENEVAEEAPAAEDADDTREFYDLPSSARFDNLQFGKDYEIK